MNEKKVKKLIEQILDLIYEIDEETLKKWICKTWPHGYGLYE